MWDSKSRPRERGFLHAGPLHHSPPGKPSCSPDGSEALGGRDGERFQTNPCPPSHTWLPWSINLRFKWKHKNKHWTIPHFTTRGRQNCKSIKAASVIQPACKVKTVILQTKRPSEGTFNLLNILKEIDFTGFVGVDGQHGGEDLAELTLRPLKHGEWKRKRKRENFNWFFLLHLIAIILLYCLACVFFKHTSPHPFLRESDLREPELHILLKTTETLYKLFHQVRSRRVCLFV